MELIFRVAVFVAVVVCAESRSISFADVAKNANPLKGITEFRIELAKSGRCIDNEAKMTSCEDNKDRNLWTWQGRQLQNVLTSDCLTFTLPGNVTVGKCAKSSKKVTKTWTCDQKRKIFASRKGNFALTVDQEGKLKATVDDGKTTLKKDRAPRFNIYMRTPYGPSIMICALWYKMGERTNDPQYYMFKNEDFKITWPTKYVKFYVVIGRPMYKRFLGQHGVNVDAAIRDAIAGGVSALDKEYRRINIRLLLTGYEVWKDHSPINDTHVYGVEKANVRAYSFNYLRSKYDYDSLVYARGGGWTEPNGKRMNLGGAGMSDICKLNKSRISTEMFIMASSIKNQQRFSNLISHEFGHQVYQGHNFEPGRPCPFYHMFGTKCTMGGNDQPKGFSINYFKALQGKERINRTSCVNKKPNLQKIQSPQTCGNGIRDVGEECDCGSSQDCLNSNPCCDGMTCQLKSGAECSNEKCCSQCKMETTGKCDGPIEVLSNSTGTIRSRATEYNSHRHWKIVGKPGEQIVLTFINLWLDFHVNCSYDYIEVRDGPDATGELLGKYCSHVHIPPFVLSSSNHLFVTFHADTTFSSKFSIRYFTVQMTDNDRTGNFSISFKTAEPTVPAKSFSKCAGKKLALECPTATVIEIESAKYGNLNNKQCGRVAAQTCVESNTESLLKKMCNGKKLCRTKPRSKLFGRQCNGTNKSIQGTYHCVKKATNAAQVKTCLTYDAPTNKLFYRAQPTCTDQFKWLDNYNLYHIGSRRCVSEYFQMTYNCYSAFKVLFKLQNGSVRNLAGTCWSKKDGVLAGDSCEKTSARFEFQ